MSNGNDKKDGAAGRARGHSFQSALWKMEDDHDMDTEQQPVHPGIPIGRLQDLQEADIGNTSPDGTQQHPTIGTEHGQTASESRMFPGLTFGGRERTAPQPNRSALTMAFQESEFQEHDVFNTPADRLADPGPVPRSNPVPIKGSSSLHQFGLSAQISPTGSESENYMPSAVKEVEAQLRKWCSGLPPKKFYLPTDDDSPPRYLMPRRSTLADKPELDSLLHATMVEYKNQKYLPLSGRTIHRLSPFWKGAKPMADMKLFEYIMITHEVNNVHADHVVAALERIGQHCDHLLVMAPIQTSELGNVFNREAGNVSPGNDWQQILQCFPNLKWLMFVHPVDVPVGLSCYTFPHLYTAVANRQAAESLKGIDFNAPPGLLAYVSHNIMTAVTTAAASDNTT